MPGVAEVATVGGFQKQYQVTVDRERLAAYNIPMMEVSDAVRNSNVESGGRLIEFSGREYMVRGHGYVKSTSDLEQVVLRTNEFGTPVLLRDVARVERGPEIRRGVADLDGRGDTVGGIIVMRHSENADKVIRAVKQKLEDIEPSLPKGVKVVTTYDRSELIESAIDNLKHELVVEMIIVSLVILIFLWHIPSAIIPIVTIPVAVLLSFIPMYFLGINSNIMSLAGIAISIGVLVDGAIVEVENAYKKLELWVEGGRQGGLPRGSASGPERSRARRSSFRCSSSRSPSCRSSPWSTRKEGCSSRWPTPRTSPWRLPPSSRSRSTRRCGCSSPGWTISGSGRVPLAWVANQVLVGKYYKEEKHPISRILFAVYEPAGPTGAQAPEDDDRDRLAARADDDSRVPAARQRIHAAAGRGHDSLHAHDSSRDLRRPGSGPAPEAGPAVDEHSGSGTGLREGRAAPKPPRIRPLSR